MLVLKDGPSSATLRQAAMDDAMGNVFAGLQGMEKQKQTKRAEALALQDHTRKLREQGYDVNEKMVADSLAPEPSGLSRFFGGDEPVKKPDLYANRTEEYKTKLASDAEEKKFKRQGDLLSQQETISKINKNNKWQPKGATANGGLALTKGQEAADKDYGKQYNSFSTKGIVNTETTLNKLETIAKELEDDAGFGEASGGSFVGGALFPDFLRSDDSIRRRDDARNAANSTLKELFPGALSDQERIAASQEYYNDKLGAKDNAKILKGKIAQLKKVRENEIRKAKYFQENGSLLGFQMDETPTGAYKEEVAETNLMPLDFNGSNPQVPFSPTKMPNMSPVQSAYAGELKQAPTDSLLKRREEILSRRGRK